MAIELEDGTVILSLPEQVEQNKAKVEEVDIKVDNLAARVQAALAGVLHYKGSVATYSDLPADAEIGDVYNVIDTGANYAWTGSEWDELGQIVDLSHLVTLDSAQTITSDKTFDNAAIMFSNDYDSTVYTISKSQSYLSIAENLQLSATMAWFNSALRPITSATQDLGSSSYKWKDLYLSNALNLGTSGILKYDSDISSFTSNSHISAAVDNNYDLGNSSQRWKDIFSSGKVYICSPGSTSNWNLSYDGSGRLEIMNETNHRYLLTWNGIIPYYTNSNDLGSSANKWKDLYLSGVINIAHSTSSSVYHIEMEQYGRVFFSRTNNNNKVTYFRWDGNTITPNTNGGSNLGTSGLRYLGIYAQNIDVSGNLTDGTNSVTVADLKALIDYAKAQGWIS